MYTSCVDVRENKSVIILHRTISSQYADRDVRGEGERGMGKEDTGEGEGVWFVVTSPIGVFSS